jgi:beta-lactamase class A
MKYLIFFSFALFSCKSTQNTKSLKADIQALTSNFKGKVGVAALHIGTGERVGIHANAKYPMQSVYKFPLALAVFDKLGPKLTEKSPIVSINKAELLQNTHSPMREVYPNGINSISLAQILKYTVTLGDNNGCDYLFRWVGSPKQVNDYVKKLKIKDIHIANTEEQMHSNRQLQYRNYASPLAMSNLLAMFWQRKVLSGPATDSLWHMLASTQTGPKRIKGLLPIGTIVGHKTGWSGTDSTGFTNAINDAGVIVLPNNNAVAISIFISDTYQKTEESELLMAKISKLVYDYFSKK